MNHCEYCGVERGTANNGCKHVYKYEEVEDLTVEPAPEYYKSKIINYTYFAGKPVTEEPEPFSYSKRDWAPTGECIYCGYEHTDHKWSYTSKTVLEESVKIVHMHILSNCGYDYDLASIYCGRTSDDEDISSHLDAVFGSGSSNVKTTGTRKAVKQYRECSECGYKDNCKLEEFLFAPGPGSKWEYAGEPRSRFYPVVWYDVNNIPDEVYDEEVRSKIKLVMWFTYGDTHNGNNGGYNEDEECKAFTEYLITHSIKDPGFNEYVMNSVTSFMNKWSETGKRTYTDIRGELYFIYKYTGLDLEPIVS